MVFSILAQNFHASGIFPGHVYLEGCRLTVFNDTKLKHPSPSTKCTHRDSLFVNRGPTLDSFRNLVFFFLLLPEAVVKYTGAFQKQQRRRFFVCPLQDQGGTPSPIGLSPYAPSRSSSLPPPPKKPHPAPLAFPSCSRHRLPQGRNERY